MSDARLDPAAVPDAVVGPTDEELMAGLAAGRLEALDTLYDRYRAMAFGIARRITSDDALAEDVVQEAFLGAWRSPGPPRSARRSARHRETPPGPRPLRGRRRT